MEFNSDFESICDPDGNETDNGVMGQRTRKTRE